MGALFAQQDYENFLDSPYKWEFNVCKNCGFYYSHPLNYCTECPNKIVRWKGTYRDYVGVHLRHLEKMKMDKLNKIEHKNKYLYTGVWFDQFPIWDFYKYLGLEIPKNYDYYDFIEPIKIWMKESFVEFSILWDRS